MEKSSSVNMMDGREQCGRKLIEFILWRCLFLVKLEFSPLDKFACYSIACAFDIIRVFLRLFIPARVLVIITNHSSLVWPKS